MTYLFKILNPMPQEKLNELRKQLVHDISSGIVFIPVELELVEVVKDDVKPHILPER